MTSSPPSDLEPVPTIRELYERKDGSAEATSFDKEMNPTAFRLLPKGERILSGAMRRNALLILDLGLQKELEVAAVRRARLERGSGGKKKPAKKSPWAPA